MRTLQINLAVASLFLMASFTANAQTNKTKSTSVKQRTEAKQKIGADTPSQRPVRYSDYMNMEKKIMTWTIAGDIPASLPKYKEGQTKEEYKLVIKNWAKNNLNLIKKEYHKRITSIKEATNTEK